MTLKLRQVGNSLTLTIPHTIALSRHLSPGSTVEMVEKEDGLFIPLEPKDEGEAYLSSLFERYDGTYEAEEIDWGEPIGEEVW